MTDDTNIIGRIADAARENLGGVIEGLLLFRTYDYGTMQEYHYLLLIRQPDRGTDGRPHWCVHTAGHHTSGVVGIVGSGSYHLEDEEAARKEFAERSNLPWPGRVPS